MNIKGRHAQVTAFFLFTPTPTPLNYLNRKTIFDFPVYTLTNLQSKKPGGRIL